MRSAYAQQKEYFDFGVRERLRAFLDPIFTAGVVVAVQVLLSAVAAKEKLPYKTKNPNPSPIEKKFGFSILTAVLPLDIPTGWEPRAKQQPTGLIAYSASQSRPVRVLYRPPQNGSHPGRHS